MSFEGHVNILCVNGHLSVLDAYDDLVWCKDPAKNYVCGNCGESMAYIQRVDDTNCDGEDYPFEPITSDHETYKLPPTHLK